MVHELSKLYQSYIKTPNKLQYTRILYYYAIPTQLSEIYRQYHDTKSNPLTQSSASLNNDKTLREYIINQRNFITSSMSKILEPQHKLRNYFVMNIFNIVMPHTCYNSGTNTTNTELRESDFDFIKTINIYASSQTALMQELSKMGIKILLILTDVLVKMNILYGLSKRQETFLTQQKQKRTDTNGQNIASYDNLLD